ncbi:MAG: hypothetical protein OEU49_01030 [Chromatiales bacterium]|jgi:hypothetical protein|nr:hypothetical protein [Chromatiales bacterium]MDH4029406.1 hypothetical protein [Chromatiales bacterium]
MFGRKSKKTGASPSSDHVVDGVIRRGLAEASGRMPSERVRKRVPPEGSNPYDTIGKSAKRVPAASPKASPIKTADACNPYNSGQEQPSKKKKSWDDVHIDVTD